MNYFVAFGVKEGLVRLGVLSLADKEGDFLRVGSPSVRLPGQPGKFVTPIAGVALPFEQQKELLTGNRKRSGNVWKRYKLELMKEGKLLQVASCEEEQGDGSSSKFDISGCLCLVPQFSEKDPDTFSLAF